MNDRHSVQTYTGDSDDAQHSPRVTEALTVGVRAEDNLGRCPTNTFEEFDWRLDFRRHIARMRDGADDGRAFDFLPRTKENLTGGMRVPDRCPSEESAGFDEWRRERRAMELARKPKI